MTKITNIREELESIIAASIAGYKQIPNPYEIEKTSNVILKKGFAIAFGPGTNTERLLSCQLSIDREMAIVLTRQVSSTEHDTNRRESIEKDILEDQFLIIRAIERDPSLNNKAARARYVGDNGLEFLSLENSRYFVLQSNFAFEYFEDLTP
jgi:hypothetical protein